MYFFSMPLHEASLTSLTADVRGELDLLPVMRFIKYVQNGNVRANNAVNPNEKNERIN